MKKIDELARLLTENKNRREIATLKKEILKKMKPGDVLISEKYRLVFTKSKRKLIIRPLITIAFAKKLKEKGGEGGRKKSKIRKGNV